ncbi:HAAAP family serine/threonine permease [Frischella sp. Ac48]|uniref:HAAAP family serine/threonine permease n=1 Tax=Frischella japonica TaxID=2741544 RepID=A0ABR7R0V0_9GAMM|nr:MULTISPECIES: serine/threonine transporter [Frischella]MBC9131898.1 HAAAP family serine/threonine permease [Frischella japonica]MBX4132575.1 HAAAP family serine/threonine permease [Frischella sp. Ac48]
MNNETITQKNVNYQSTTDNKFPRWRASDTVWMLSLYGTAVGAGVLFLPINAGVGGLIPLLVMLVLAFPMTFFAHQALCRFVLSGKNNDSDITDVVEQAFGRTIGDGITLLYFLAIYPILLVYSVGVTNTVDSFIVHQLGFSSPPRILLSFILLAILMSIVHFGENLIVKVMSVLVFPFLTVLMAFALFLIPEWNMAIFDNFSWSGNVTNQTQSIWLTLWLVIPVMVFAFNHSAIISSLAVAKRQEYGDQFAEAKCTRIIAMSNVMMVVTVMFFVFSCVLCLTPAELLEAKAQNISILSYLANRFNSPLIEYVAPPIALVAMSKSFLGHYLGAREGFNGVVTKALRYKNISIMPKRLNNITAIFMFLTTWIVATFNPSILTLIESLGGPVQAILLFILPMYAIHKLPALANYRGRLSNLFIVITGLIAISATLYGLM